MTTGELTSLDLGPVSITITRRWHSGEFSRTADLMLRGAGDVASVGTIEFSGDDSSEIDLIKISPSHPYKLLQPFIDAVRDAGIAVLIA